MKTLAATIRRFPIASFYVLTFAIPWLIWIPATPFLQDPSNISLGVVLAAYLGLYTPTIMALVLTRIEHGTHGMGALLRQFWTWRVAKRWYAFALLSPLAVGLAAMGVYALAGGTVPAIKFNVLALVFLVIGGPLAEQMGWRGYAEPRLQARFGAWMGSLIGGVLWALWHLPGFVWPSLLYNVPLPFTWFLLQVVAWSFLFTWLYNHTQGSLLLAFLFHWSIDAMTSVLPIATPGIAWSNVALSWLLVLAILVRERTQKARTSAVVALPSQPSVPMA